MPRTSYIADPILQGSWQALCSLYFPEQPDLANYQVGWSIRSQRRVLASVSLRARVVRVAKELRHPAALPYLSPILYHELCHAALGLGIHKPGFRTPWHGADFKALEERHPEMHHLKVWIKSGGWHALTKPGHLRRRRKAKKYPLAHRLMRRVVNAFFPPG